MANPVPTELVPTIKAKAAPAPKSSAQRADPQTNGEMPINEAIRLDAYLKWENAGRPAGDGVAFWLEAERELIASR